MILVVFGSRILERIERCGPVGIVGDPRAVPMLTSYCKVIVDDDIVVIDVGLLFTSFSFVLLLN